MTIESKNKPGWISREFHSLQILWQEERRRCRVVYGSQELGRRLFVKERRGDLSSDLVFRRLNRLDVLGYSSSVACITYNNLCVREREKRLPYSRKA